MIDLATTRFSLQAPRRNTLENILFPKSWRSFFAGLALITLAAGWHAFHHMAPAAGQVANPAGHTQILTQGGKKAGTGGILFAIGRRENT